MSFGGARARLYTRWVVSYHFLDWVGPVYTRAKECHLHGRLFGVQTVLNLLLAHELTLLELCSTDARGCTRVLRYLSSSHFLVS